MTLSTDSAVRFDPYDVEINADPYPTFKRLREEAPLYYNAQYDFYALSRFADVNKALVDHETFSSARGAILELIKANMEIPSGALIFEDPPSTHPPQVAGPDVHPAQDRRAGAPDPGVTAPKASTRWSAPAGSTSSPISAPDADAGRSAAARHPRGRPGD